MSDGSLCISRSTWVGPCSSKFWVLIKDSVSSLSSPVAYKTSKSGFLPYGVIVIDKKEAGVHCKTYKLSIFLTYDIRSEHDCLSGVHAHHHGHPVESALKEKQLRLLGEKPFPRIKPTSGRTASPPAAK